MTRRRTIPSDRVARRSLAEGARNLRIENPFEGFPRRVRTRDAEKFLMKVAEYSEWSNMNELEHYVFDSIQFNGGGDYLLNGENVEIWADAYWPLDADTDDSDDISHFGDVMIADIDNGREAEYYKKGEVYVLD